MGPNKGHQSFVGNFYLMFFILARPTFLTQISDHCPKMTPKMAKTWTNLANFFCMTFIMSQASMFQFLEVFIDYIKK